MTRLNLPCPTVQEYERAAQEYLESLPLEHFMEAKPQGTQREITLESLALLKARRPEVQVFNEMLVQYPLARGIGQVVPDNMVVIGDEPAIAEGSFNIPHAKARPFWVLEYVSAASRRKDYKDSFRKYEKDLKVPYCLLFYPERQDLRVYRHGCRRYRRVQPNDAGRYPIPELDLEIGLQDGWVRFWYRSQLLELPAELDQALNAAKQRADREEERRRTAEAEVARLRALVEKLQAEQQRQKPATE
jgi:Uma2 family endonuclease